MEINFLKHRAISKTNVYKTTEKGLKSFLYKLNSTGSYTQIGDIVTLNDGTSINIKEIPKLNIQSLNILPTAKDNVMDFGSGFYFKYTNSRGKSLAIFSMPGGSLYRPLSEYLTDSTEFDIETERYMHFWNNLSSGSPFMLPPGNSILPQFGYSHEDERNYLDEAGISKGFFSVKIGSRKSDYFYSNSEHCVIHKKEDYDFRYYTMTSSDFSYNKSVFSSLEPGTEITIAGEKYTVKDNLTLDIPYGIDIFDIQIPKHEHKPRASSGIDCKA